MGGAESKTATLRLATEKLAELKGGNVDGAIAQKKLENKIRAVDEDTDERVKEIKATPIDKEQIKAQSKSEYESKLKQNARDKVVAIKQAESEIEQAKHNVTVTEKSANAYIKEAELNLENAKKQAETMKQQAALTVKSRTDRLEQIKEIATEEEERRNLKAKQELDSELRSVENAEKAMQMRVDKAIAEGKKKKRELEEELDLLKIRNSSKSSGVELYERLFVTVEKISAPVETADPEKKKK
jgi:hypothetical protein